MRRISWPGLSQPWKYEMVKQRLQLRHPWFDVVEEKIESPQPKSLYDAPLSAEGSHGPVIPGAYERSMEKLPIQALNDVKCQVLCLWGRLVRLKKSEWGGVSWRNKDNWKDNKPAPSYCLLLSHIFCQYSQNIRVASFVGCRLFWVISSGPQHKFR